MSEIAAREPVSCAPLTAAEARRIRRRTLNYPLYVPDMGRDVTLKLINGELAGLVTELHRLTLLGSNNAAAFLTFLRHRNLLSETPEAADAEKRCRAAAHSNHSYSQYVVAWLCKAEGDDNKTMEWLRKSSSRGLFLPAFLDVARFIVGGAGVDAPNHRAALSIFWNAHRLGHRMALVYCARVLSSGNLGLLWWPVGVLLYLPAFFRAYWFGRRYPLSEKVYVTPTNSNRPLFRVSDGKPAEIDFSKVESE